ncbi:MAG: hypothetical protein ACJ8CR_09290 [Roseiflexaceae bacterium]
MSEPAEGTPTKALNAASAPAPRRGGCVGRFLSALLVIAITTLLSLTGVALAYVYFLDTPNQLGELRGRVATAEVQNAGLRAENSTMQTQVADLARAAGANREALGELQQQKDTLDGLREELETRARQNATVVAEARSSRDAIALFATAEAGRAGLIDDLKRRSDRIERFLQRLSDISGDAALDLGGDGSPAPPTPTTLPPEPPTPTAPPLSNTPAPTTTSAPSDTPVPTATSTPNNTPSSAPSETPTRRPTATPQVTATP